MALQDVAFLLRDRFRQCSDPLAVELRGTPFTRIERHVFNPHQGVPFVVYRLGDQEQRLALAEGRYWEYVVLQKGEYAPHIHDEPDTVLLFVSGQGDAYINGTLCSYNPDSIFMVPAAAPHGFRPHEISSMLSIVTKPIVDPEQGIADVRPFNDFKFPPL